MERRFLVPSIVIVVLGLGLVGLAVQRYMTRAEPLRPVPAAKGSRRLSEREIIERFHQLSYNDKRTWPQNRWLGIATYQNPNDVWITQEIIQEVKPDFIVEAGTFHGGSAALWATVLVQVNPKGRVITIDIEDHTSEARKLPIFRQRVDFLLGSSTDPKIVAEVRKRAGGGKVLVILDSDHKKAHVLEELAAYGPLVSVGSYLIVQDTNINGHPVLSTSGPGPMEAVEEFLASNRQFESDRSRERLLFTMNPKGYLKRVK